MNAILPKDRKDANFKKPYLREDHRDKVMVHGAFHYQCERCRHQFRMWLEDGVEGENKKQPCPFIIRCPECGGTAQHVAWHTDLKLDELQPLAKGMKFFAFDNSGKHDACGKASIFVGNGKAETHNERLTMRTPQGACLILQATDDVSARYELMSQFKFACEKLADYEDLEEKGLLIKLPCQIGNSTIKCVDGELCITTTKREIE